MRPLALAIPVALLTLLPACSTSSQPVDLTTAPPTTQAPAAEPTAAGPTSAGPTSAGGDDKAGGAGQSLTGALGENNAFVITLKDDKGAPVTTLKAGTYQMKIKDTSAIHNFHLTGPGGIDQTTTIPEIKETTWPVKLVAGTYTYKCDPHANMIGTFTVT